MELGIPCALNVVDVVTFDMVDVQGLRFAVFHPFHGQSATCLLVHLFVFYSNSSQYRSCVKFWLSCVCIGDKFIEYNLFLQQTVDTCMFSACHFSSTG